MEWIEPLEAGLAAFVTLLKLTLETIAALCVFLGLVAALKLAIGRIRHRRWSEPFSSIRLRFGTWLALALEFELGADIVGTTIAPSLESLAQLGVIAVIRTFLNYFLRKELEAEERMAKTRQQTEMAQPS